MTTHTFLRQGLAGLLSVGLVQHGKSPTGSRGSRKGAQQGSEPGAGCALADRNAVPLDLSRMVVTSSTDSPRGSKEVVRPRVPPQGPLSSRRGTRGRTGVRSTAEETYYRQGSPGQSSWVQVGVPEVAAEGNNGLLSAFKVLLCVRNNIRTT